MSARPWWDWPGDLRETRAALSDLLAAQFAADRSLDLARGHAREVLHNQRTPITPITSGNS